jgi:GPH family glycoside/pentoside/hexuronide:cation symporter
MNESIEKLRGEKSTSKKLLFGLPRLGTSIVLGVESWALLTLYTSGYGLNPFLAGLAIAMGYLTIAASQFLFGWLSDAKYTKFGRRKPYLIIFGPLLGLSTIFLLLPSMFLPDLNDQFALFLWMLVWDVLFRVGYALTTPYQAWMAEVFDVNDRPKVSQYQNTFNFVGNGIMALFSLLIVTSFVDALKVDVNASVPMIYLIPIVIFGILVVVLFYLIAFLFPTEPNYEIKSNLKESLRATVQNKNFMLIVLMMGISGFGWSMLSTGMLKYLDDALQLSTTEYLIAAVILLLSIFIFIYLWRKTIEKKGKKATLLYVFILAVFFLPITLLSFIPMSSHLILGILFIAGVGAILGGWYLFPYIVYADVAEDDEKSTGDLKAGTYAGFPSIILNLFQAIGAIVIGSIFSLPTITVGSLEPFSIGLAFFGPLCSLILIVSYFYTKKYVKLDFDWEKK